MDDKKIVELFWERSEDAIRQTDEKYGKYCYYIAYNILYSDLDSEECVSDTYLQAWASMPPQKPERLSTYLGKITRNLAINRYDHKNALKRKSQTALIIDEIQEFTVIPDSEASPIEQMMLRDAINSFLGSLPAEARIIFVRRYWYCSPISDIAKDYSLPEGTVRSTLSRTRKRFREYLTKEGVAL
jgi:RNA polymerase sigma-70 factor (ECF subfamily)